MIGPIYSLNLGGKHAIVVNTHKIASELLDRRSLIYSDRPRMIMPEILCDNLFFPFNAYGDTCVCSRVYPDSESIDWLTFHVSKLATSP